MADGLYIGGVLNAVPRQYVRFAADGITVVSETRIKLQSPTVEIDGDLHATGAVIAGFGGGDQVGLETHTHPGGVPPPTPGT